MNIKIPFQIVNGNVEQETDLKRSVNQFVDMLVATAIGQFKADADFGFVFKNFRFENFDEKKRTVANMREDEFLNEYKITGSSKNPKNFAYMLKRNIEQYEPRLTINEVTMDYSAQKHNVMLLISGQLKTDKPQAYSHAINFHVW